MFDEDSKAKFALYLAVFLTVLGYSGRYIGVEPLNNQFFVFAVWSFVLLADNLTYRFKGNSLLISRTPEFLVLAAWSLAIAGLLELLNLRLGAWHYLNQSSDLSMRWTGRALTWASVLPSLFIVDEMFRSFGLFRGLKSKVFKIKPGLIEGFYTAGVALLCLALAAPGFFWPLALPAVFFLAEPLNLRLGLPSLLREWEGGLPGKTLRLAAAGLTCGLLWNWWNWAAGSGWKYDLPSPLSEMPAAVYAGFPLLGLAAYSLYSLASYLRAGKTWEETAWPMPGKPPAAAVQWAAAALLLITSYIALRAVDSHTVKMFLGWI
ncbi:MAG: hypothetical protein Q7R35_01290 [Elusimicrobiota bacterium]|nr:hypothetical protein [Elusimicrobiota bacterium]